jgi:DNA-binding IclR family transcriptional regulator
LHRGRQGAADAASQRQRGGAAEARGHAGFQREFVHDTGRADSGYRAEPVRGYAVDEGEQEIGVRCFAVPVPDAPTLTAISISGPAARLTLKSATKVTPLLKRVARDIASEFDKEAAV